MRNESAWPRTGMRSALVASGVSRLGFPELERPQAKLSSTARFQFAYSVLQCSAPIRRRGTARRCVATARVPLRYVQ